MPQTQAAAGPASGHRSLIDLLAEASRTARPNEPAVPVAPRASAAMTAPQNPARSVAAPGLVAAVETILRGPADRRASAPPALSPAGSVSPDDALPKLSDIRKLADALRLVGDMAEAMAQAETPPAPAAIERDAHRTDFARTGLESRAVEIGDRLDHLTLRFDEVARMMTGCLADLAADVATLRQELAGTIRREQPRPQSVLSQADEMSRAMQDLKALRDQLTGTALDRSRPLR